MCVGVYHTIYSHMPQALIVKTRVVAVLHVRLFFVFICDVDIVDGPHG